MPAPTKVVILNPAPGRSIVLADGGPLAVGDGRATRRSSDSVPRLLVIAHDDVHIDGNDGSFDGDMTAPARDALGVADRVALGALGGALLQARERGERRPALEVLAAAVADLGVTPWAAPCSARVVREDRDAWLRRLTSAQRSDAAMRAYRHAIDDLLAWADRHGRATELVEERTIVDYLDDYRTRCRPAPATYHRRFLLLRRFMRWVAP
jgi:hypothetical protein